MTTEIEDRIANAVANGAAIQAVAAPFFYATNVSVASTSNSFSVTFQRTAPAVVPLSHSEVAQIGTLVPVAILDLSPHSMKDLALVFADAVARWEEEYGKIETDFTRKRASDGV